MSDSEKEFSFLHNQFVFKKTENASDKVYSKLIIEIRDNLLSKSNIEINDWINLKFTNNQLKILIDNIKIYIKN